MTSKKTIWTPREVEDYLKNIPKGNRLTLPSGVYATESFSWNEVLMTNSEYMDMPSRQILENLKSSADVLQDYRDRIGKPITITSGWRTPKKQSALIKAFNDQAKTKNTNDKGPAGKPSSTSLHLEGLAIDFVVNGVSPLSVYEHFNTNFFGELERDARYTHVGLPSFSEGYLKRHGIYSDKVYRKLSMDGITLTPYEKTKIVKRIRATDCIGIPSKFDAKKNVETYKNIKVNQKKQHVPAVSKPSVSQADTRTPSQKFSDQIRADYHRMVEERNRRVLGRNYPNRVASGGDGHWVTIDGRHVFIEN